MIGIATLALVFVVYALHVAAAWESTRREGLPLLAARRTALSVATVLGVLFMLAVVTTRTAWLSDFQATPPHLVRFIGPHVMLALVVGAVSPYGRRLATSLPLAWLIGFQAFRIPVEWLLHEFYREGLAPIQITYLGRNFDILSGLTAIPVAWLVARGAAPTALIRAWNWLGVCLLGNVVGVALMSMPGPFRYFLNEPSTAFIGGFPYVFVPTLFVPTALLGHVLVFRRLRGQGQ